MQTTTVGELGFLYEPQTDRLGDLRSAVMINGPKREVGNDECKRACTDRPRSADPDAGNGGGGGLTAVKGETRKSEQWLVPPFRLLTGSSTKKSARAGLQNGATVMGDGTTGPQKVIKTITVGFHCCV